MCVFRQTIFKTMLTIKTKKNQNYISKPTQDPTCFVIKFNNYSKYKQRNTHRPLEWQDSNLRITVSKTAALPLGYTPIYPTRNTLYTKYRM